MKLPPFRIAPESHSAPPSSFAAALLLALAATIAGCGGSVTEESTGGGGGSGGSGGAGGGTTTTGTSTASTSTTTDTPSTTTTTGENPCEDAGGACVALVPDACENGTWLDAKEFPCGTGEGVGCCLIAACTPGMDQTCNASPSMSSFAGQCNPDGTCTCNPGFTKNADGKCG